MVLTRIPLDSKPPILPAETAGKRLDAALGEVLDELGLRGRRRLWRHFRVLLDGRERGPAHRVAGGETVTFRPRETEAVPASGIRLIGRSAGYAAFFKPAGLPTAALAGSPSASLEGLLPTLWEELRRDDPALPPQPPLLLTRLDTPTSGLVLGAFGLEAAKAFRALEAAGRTRKYYLALVHGRLELPLVLDQALDTADRKKTRVLAEADPDAGRHTLVEPVRSPDHSPDRSPDRSPVRPAEVPDTPSTLVRAVIVRGARHQIRAHLAFAGHPLVGDALYGGAGDPTDFFLRHYRLELPDSTFDLEAHDV